MFPSFPHLAETIAAERAADFQREAAAYRRARGIRRARVTDAVGAVARSRRIRHSADASHVGFSIVGSGSVGSSTVAARVTRTDSCVASRAI